MLLDMIATGPFTARERDGAWVVLDGRGVVFATVHGECAYHDAPLIAERLTRVSSLAQRAEEAAEAEARAEEAEDEAERAKADFLDAERENNVLLNERADLRREIAVLRGEAVPS